MNQLNQIILEGNIVRVPEIKDTANHSRLAVFSIAVNRYYKKADGTFEQEVSYFDVEAWGALAESVEKKASKGIGCRVIGRLKQDRWKGNDGKAYSKVSVVLEHIDFVKDSAKTERSESDSTETTAQENQTDDEKPQKKKASKFDKSALFGNQNPESSVEEDLPKAAGFDIF